MTKTLKDFAPYYVGCDLLRPDGKTILQIYGVQDSLFIHRENNELTYSGMTGSKLILRPISSMTDEEKKDIYSIIFKRPFPSTGDIIFMKASRKSAERWILMTGVDRVGIEHDGDVWADCDLNNYKFNPHEVTRYLLSKGFDIFGLIESGLAVDKTKI